MTDQPLQLGYASPQYPLPRRDPRQGKPVWELFTLPISLFLYGVGAWFLIAILAGVLGGLVGAPALGFPNILAGVLLIPMLASLVTSLRNRRASAVLGYLQQAIRLNLPIPRLLAAAAFSEEGKARKRLLALKEYLEFGMPLGDAIYQAVPEMPMRTIGLIDFASRTGSLPQALNRLVEENLRKARRQRNDQAFAAWYPFLMIVVAGGVIGLIDVFVAPKFTQIFKDFRIPMPGVLLLAESTADWAWVIVPLAGIILFASLGYQLRKTFGIYHPVWILSRWSDEMAWRLPVLHTLVRDRNMTDVCTSLADSVELGYPLDLSIDRLGHLQLNAVMRERTLRWVQAIRGGLSPADAARHARMPRLLVGMMATARDTAGLAEVFSFVARFHGDRFLLRREALRAAVIPVFTILMGIAVAFVALSLFIPMDALITKVSP